MKRLEEIISDKDVALISKLTAGVDRSIGSLRNMDSVIKELQKKYDNLGTSASKFNDAIKQITSTTSDLSKFANELTTIEGKLSNITAKMAVAFDKIAESKKAASNQSLEGALSTEQSKGGKTIASPETLAIQQQKYNAELEKQLALQREIKSAYESSPDKSTAGALAMSEELKRIQRKIDKLRELSAVSAQQQSVGTGTGLNPDFANAQQEEASIEQVVALNKERLAVLKQILELKAKINMANADEVSDLNVLEAKYRQINASIGKVSGGVAQGESTPSGTTTEVEMAMQNQMIKEKNALIQEEARAKIALTALDQQRAGVLSDEQKANRLAIEEAKQREGLTQKQIQTQVKLKLVNEELTSINTQLTDSQKKLNEAKSNGSSSQYINNLKKEIKTLKEQQTQLGVAKSTLEAGLRNNANALKVDTASYYTTEQFMQVVRELPNFAISARIGIMSLSNNLPQMITGFAKAAQSGLKFKQILGNLLSPMSLINIAATALTILFMNWDNIMKMFSGDAIDVSDALNKVGGELRNMQGEAVKSLQAFEDLRYNLNQWDDNLENLKKYNEEFGQTFGLAKSTAEAYDLMRANANQYYEDVLRHEIANQIRLKYFDESMKELGKEVGGRSGFARFFGIGDERLGDKIEDVTKSYEVFANNLHKIRLNSLTLEYEDLNSLKKVLEKSDYDKFYKKFIDQKRKLSKEGAEGSFFGPNAIDISSFLSDEEIEYFLNKVRDKMQNDVSSSMQGFFEKFVPKFEAVNLVAGGIDVDMTKYEKEKGGGGSGYGRRLQIQERLFRDLFKKEEQYNKERAELEIENELLQMTIAANAYNTEQNMLNNRLAAYQKFYQNKQRILEIDKELELKKISEQRQAEVFAAQERLKNAQEQLRKDEERLAEFDKRVIEDNYTSKIADTDKKIAELTKKLADPAVQANTDRLEQYTTQLKGLNSVLDQLKIKQKNATDDYNSSSAAIEKTRKNVKDLAVSVGQAIETINQNAQTKSLIAVDNFALSIVKAKREELQSYADLYKERLDTESKLIKDAYDKQLELLDDYINERKRRISTLGGDTSGGTKIGLGIAEFLGQGATSYQRPQYIDDMQDLSLQIEEITRKKQEEIFKNDELVRSYQYVIGEVEKYGKTSEITSEQIAEWSKQTGEEVEKAAIANGDSAKVAAEKGEEAANRVLGIFTKLNEEGKLNATDLNKAIQDLSLDTLKITDKTDKDILDKKKQQTEALKKEMINQGLELAKGLVNLGQALFDASLEYQRRAIDNWKQTQSQLIDDAVASQVLTQKEGDSQRKALEEEERKRRYEVAVREHKQKQAMAISDILISSAISAAWAWVQAKGNAIYAGILTALIAANAAVGTATVLAQPAPAYAEGTDFHKGGLAIVGDGGRSEAIITPAGNIYKTPDTDTLINLQRGSKVMPDFDAFMFKQVSASDKNINVKMDNQKMLSLQKQTNKNLQVIARNTRYSKKNYNRLWN